MSNNKINFYRVENCNCADLIKIINYPRKCLPFGFGPYSFFNSDVWEKELSLSVPYTKEQFTKFCSFANDECREYRILKIDNYKVSYVPTLPRTRRPGPFEDIDLREKMIKHMGKMTKYSRWHFYGFNNLIQLLSWFDNPEELKFLHEMGFILSNYLVPSKDFIIGKNQSVFFPTRPYQEDIILKSRTELTKINSAEIEINFLNKSKIKKRNLRCVST
jgi:hypothetical protein